MISTATRFAGRQTELAIRDSDQGAANADLVLSTPGGQLRWVRGVAVHYSAVPAQAGITVELLSGAGAAFNTVLYSGSANTQDSFFLPNHPILLLPDDQIQVTAPAGGAAITAAASIYTLGQGAAS